MWPQGGLSRSIGSRLMWWSLSGGRRPLPFFPQHHSLNSLLIFLALCFRSREDAHVGDFSLVVR